MQRLKPTPQKKKRKEEKIIVRIFNDENFGKKILRESQVIRVDFSIEQILSD